MNLNKYVNSITESIERIWNLNRFIRPQLLGQHFDQVLRLGLESGSGLANQSRVGVCRAEFGAAANYLDGLFELALLNQNLLKRKSDLFINDVIEQS